MTGRIVAEGIYKRFASQQVLRGLDLDVPAGSFTAILGPSGSGKTTLLRVLAGLERADAGRVVIGDSVVDDEGLHVPPERRSLGYVSQEGSLFPHLSVEANVGFGLPRRERKSAKVPELLGMVGLAGLDRRYPHELSGGQQQRVAVARALAIEPRAVLLDEPFASLDAQLRAVVRSDVRDVLRASGTTAVLVTHDQDEALSIADFVAVIRDGDIAQVGTPEQLYAAPVDADLARFLGAANIVTGEQSGTTVRCVLGVLESAASLSATVSVLVRPEQVEVGGVTGSDDEVAASVVSTSYHGHDCLLALDLAGGAAIVARVLGDPGLAPGTAVSVRVRGTVRSWAAPQAGGPAQDLSALTEQAPARVL